MSSISQIKAIINPKETYIGYIVAINSKFIEVAVKDGRSILVDNNQSNYKVGERVFWNGKILLKAPQPDENYTFHGKYT